MVNHKKCNLFFGPKISVFGQKYDFCYTTPILVNGPFVALREAVHFPPWERFSDFPFRSYSSFCKKNPVTRQKVFPLPTVGAGHRLPVTALDLSARRPFGPARFVRGLDNTIMSGLIKFAKCKSDFILLNNIPSAKYCCCYWYPQVSISMIKPVRLHVHQLNY